MTISELFSILAVAFALAALREAVRLWRGAQ